MRRGIPSIILLILFLPTLIETTYGQTKKPAEKLLEIHNITRKLVAEQFNPIIEAQSCSSGDQFFIMIYGTRRQIQNQKAILAGTLHLEDCHEGYEGYRITFVETGSNKKAPLTVFWRVFPNGELPKVKLR